MAKKVLSKLKLQIEGGQATPAWPVGPALGQYGVNIMAFVKEYNERTSSQIGSIVPAELTIFEDRSFYVHHQEPSGVRPPTKGGRRGEGQR